MSEPLKILMLEDNPYDADLVHDLLKKALRPFIFLVVTDKHSYLQSLDEFQPHLVLCDYTLPQFNGKEALEILRSHSTHIPFILITATASDEFGAEIIKSGADDYILKDRPARLPAAIQAAVKQRKAQLEKQKAEEETRLSEENYRSLLERISDGFVAFDKYFRYTYLNSRAGTLIRRHPTSLLGENVWKEFPDVVGSATYSSLVKAMEEQRYNCIIDYYAPLDIWLESHIYPSPEGLSVFMRDITARKKAEALLRDMEQTILSQKIEEQKKITRAIIHAQEKERNRIGQELHDNINQILASIKLFLQLAADKNKKTKELIREPMDLIDTSIREIRILSGQNVTPLKNVDLREMIEMLLDQVSANTDMKTEFTYKVPDNYINDDLKVNIYRITQELVYNSLKHSGAKNLFISVVGDSEKIDIRIGDDGSGFDMTNKRTGIGISNVINRVESFNGTVFIDSSPGNGCTIQCEFRMGSIE